MQNVFRNDTKFLIKWKEVMEVAVSLLKLQSDLKFEEDLKKGKTSFTKYKTKLKRRKIQTRISMNLKATHNMKNGCGGAT